MQKLVAKKKRGSVDKQTKLHQQMRKQYLSGPIDGHLLESLPLKPNLIQRINFECSMPMNEIRDLMTELITGLEVSAAMSHRLPHGTTAFGYPMKTGKCVVWEIICQTSVQVADMARTEGYDVWCDLTDDWGGYSSFAIESDQTEQKYYNYLAPIQSANLTGELFYYHSSPAQIAQLNGYMHLNAHLTSRSKRAL